LRIFSPEPAFIRASLAWMFEYKPGLVAIVKFLPFIVK
jgi:hypothetical protein